MDDQRAAGCQSAALFEHRDGPLPFHARHQAGRLSRDCRSSREAALRHNHGADRYSSIPVVRAPSMQTLGSASNQHFVCVELAQPRDQIFAPSQMHDA